MTTPSTDAAQPALGEQQKEGLDLSPAKILASALAAISTSVAASYLGTLGTWIGAGVGSVVATVSTALYHHSLKRTGAKLKTVVPLPAGLIRRRDPASSPPPDDQSHPPLGSSVAGRARAIGQLLRSLRWGRVLAVAGVVFALSIGTIVTYELLTHRPLSAQLRGDDVQGTSLTPNQENTAPATPDAVPSGSATPDAAPSEKASPKAEPSSPAESAQPAPSS
jgi:hypothetical protein